MRAPLRKFYAFLDQPLFGGARVVLALLIVPLLLTFTAPLWRIDLSAPRTVMARTANGDVPAQLVTLNSVRVGDVELYNVAAVVVPQPMPMVLLGNSFLSRLQMRRENDVMRLELR